MTPASFTFTLTVPRDPALAAVVTEVVTHAVTYAEMDPAAGAAFVKGVAAATAEELSGGEPASCEIVVTCTDGELRLTIGAHTVSQRRST